MKLLVNWLERTKISVLEGGAGLAGQGRQVAARLHHLLAPA